MPSFFQLTLDTTAPQGPVFEIAAGAPYVSARDVAIVLTTTDAVTDGYQVKVWGDVDAAANAAVQTLEADSSWVDYGTLLTVRLAGGDGPKTLHAKIRDDVGNETAELEDSTTLDTSAPVVTITVDPDRDKISKVPGFDTSIFTFTVDVDVVAWKVKAVPDSGATHDQGTEIPDAGGSTGVTGAALAAATPQQVAIKGEDLQSAVGPDGTYTIKVFAQDVAGLWSTS